MALGINFEQLKGFLVDIYFTFINKKIDAYECNRIGNAG